MLWKCTFNSANEHMYWNGIILNLRAEIVWSQLAAEIILMIWIRCNIMYV